LGEIDLLAMVVGEGQVVDGRVRHASSLH
jgi:hypothetical protein